MLVVLVVQSLKLPLEPTLVLRFHLCCNGLDLRGDWVKTMLILKLSRACVARILRVSLGSFLRSHGADIGVAETLDYGSQALDLLQEKLVLLLKVLHCLG